MPAFQLARATTVRATPAQIHPLIDDFREWQRWSPWEELDPDMERTFAGPAAGVGSRYAWKGNNKVGEGSMEITASVPAQVDIALEFLKPLKASNQTTFLLQPEGDATRVTWRMSGQRNPLMTLLGKVFFDRRIAQDFDKGLTRLKAAAES